MKNLKLKTTSGSQGILSLQHPSAVVGMSRGGNVATYEITEIPDAVEAAEVVRLANATAFVGTYAARYDQLGEGRILRK